MQVLEPVRPFRIILQRPKRIPVGLAVLCLALFSAPAQDVARPKLVQEVLAGKRHEARVSWWGFDARDSTLFLQNAINSKVKKLILDRQPSPWVTRPLTGVSHQEIVFESGAELVALKGAYQGKGDSVLSFQECEHVTIRGPKHDNGKSVRIRMHKQDYQSGTYEKSEWRHGLFFAGCSKVKVQDLTIEQTGGDGIYCGATRNRTLNREIVIRRVNCSSNHRQGISVISAENLLIENCVFRNTDGTAPRAGIDFEPNNATECLVNCVVRNCVSENNAGSGFLICPQALTSSSRPLSISLEDCVSRGNGQHAVHLCSAQKDPPGGFLKISRLTSDNNGMAGLSVQFNPYDAIHVEVEKSTFRAEAQNDSFFTPIYLQGMDSETRPLGNIHFRSVTIFHNQDTPFLKIRDRKGNGIRNVTGSISLQSDGTKRTFALNDKMLNELAQNTSTNAYIRVEAGSGKGK